MVMTKSLLVLMLTAVWLTGCYTVLKPIPPTEQEVYNRTVMKRAVTIDPALLGNWSNTIDAMDAPNAVRNLTFNKDGKIIFSSSGHVKNGGHRVGTYRIVDDTLVVLFASSYFAEKFLYTVDPDQLILTSLRHDNNETYALVESSPFRYVRKPH
jgi:uncharacterized protein YceK